MNHSSTLPFIQIISTIFSRSSPPTIHSTIGAIEWIFFLINFKNTATRGAEIFVKNKQKKQQQSKKKLIVPSTVYVMWATNDTFNNRPQSSLKDSSAFLFDLFRSKISVHFFLYIFFNYLVVRLSTLNLTILFYVCVYVYCVSISSVLVIEGQHI